MTDLAATHTLTNYELHRSGNETSPPMPSDIEETRRTADIRSPLTNDYDIPTMLNLVLARESATCEACQMTVHHPEGGDLAEGDPFVIRRLVENVYTAENFVLLCDTCVNRPTDEWRSDVRAKRARERDYTPTWSDHLAHWLSDPTASSLFARRVTATVVGWVSLVTLIAVTAGIIGSLITGVSTGAAWTRTVIATASAAGIVLVEHPWSIGVLLAVAYTAHAIERVHYDPRGYVPREHQPWVVLTFAGVIAGVGALGLLGVATEVVPTARLGSLLAAIIWAIGAAGVAWYIDLALRHDLFERIWSPAREVWMVAGRVGILPGMLAIIVGVPFPGVFADTATAVLAAIPAGVALTFTARRLPYDTQTRDRILGLMPQWLLERRRSD